MNANLHCFDSFVYFTRISYEFVTLATVGYQRGKRCSVVLATGSAGLTDVSDSPSGGIVGM